MRFPIVIDDPRVKSAYIETGDQVDPYTDTASGRLVVEFTGPLTTFDLPNRVSGDFIREKRLPENPKLWDVCAMFRSS